MNMSTQNKDFLRLVEEGLDHIRTERLSLLTEVSNYIQKASSDRGKVDLIFICTHNSRRSHISQLWAQVAADHYGVPWVNTYSGGTEATAFHPNAVAAMQRAGFVITKKDEAENPVYQLTYPSTGTIQEVWSKVYDDQANPSVGFGAIMTCSSADEHCPFIPGADIRVPLTYDDPKVSDGTGNEAKIYDERCLEIAREMFCLFALARKGLS